jgi:excisionase family DNA binding protein
MTAVIKLHPEGQYSSKDIDALIHAIETRVQAREVMRIEQAADFLSVSRRKLDDLCRSGKMPFHRIEGLGGKIFLRSELIEYVKKS